MACICTRKISYQLAVALLAVWCVLVLLPISSAAGKKSPKAKVKEESDTALDDSSLTVEIQHAIGEGYDFQSRGIVSVRSLKASLSTVSFLQESLTLQQLQAIKAAAMAGGYYFLRARAKFIDAHSETPMEEDYVSTFISACSLVRSKLSDVITIAGDGRGNIIGLTITTPLLSSQNRDCQDSEVQLPHHFNTSISLDNGTPGPVPDAQGFLQKLEKEERQKRDGVDNRSFLQKYWLYIVLGILVFTMLQGQGGGGGGGGQ